jgi:hypothetical protein
MKLIRVGVDLAKTVFHVHGVDRNEGIGPNLRNSSGAPLLTSTRI